MAFRSPMAASAEGGFPYVRLSAKERDSRPWQVRRNRPDQTFEIVSRHATRHGAALAMLGTPRSPSHGPA